LTRHLYGVHPVREALKAGRVESVFIAEGDNSPALRPLIEEAQRSPAQVLFRPRAVLDQLSRGAPHQGVVAIAGEYPYVALEDLLESSLKAPRPPLILVLDSVQDPQNLGALVRTAHVAGADGVVIPKDRAVAVTPAVVKASAGATEHTRIAQVVNVARALEQIKEAGLWIAGAVAAGGVEPWKVDLGAPTALVLGAEGKGIRPLVLRGCDLLVRIPMVGKVASLNVAAAGAILLYEALRQRQLSQG
jgi:23S rRNA (guanosine2251-2'-O)-methyltransferase